MYANNTRIKKTNKKNKKRFCYIRTEFYRECSPVRACTRAHARKIFTRDFVTSMKIRIVLTNN